MLCQLTTEQESVIIECAKVKLLNAFQTSNCLQNLFEKQRLPKVKLQCSAVTWSLITPLHQIFEIHYVDTEYSGKLIRYRL